MRTQAIIRAALALLALLAFPRLSLAQGALSNGAIHTGSITLGDLDTWTFTANQGDYVVVRVGEVPPPGTDPGFWPFVQLIGTNGSTVLDQATANTDAEVVIAAPLTGTYTVRISAYYTGGTGNYLLTLAKTPGAFATSGGDQGGPLTNGLRHAGHTYVGDVDMWSFDANQNDDIVVRIGEVPVPQGQTDPGYWPFIRVIGPTGALMDQATADTDAETWFNAPLTGTYTVLVSAYYSNGSNDYLLALAKAPGAFQTAQTDQGGALTNGLRHQGLIGVGDLDLWSFDANQNDQVVVRIGEVPVGPGTPDPGFWPFIRIVGPNGNVMDQATADVDAETTFRAPLSGTYTVIVSAYYSNGAGEYLLAFAKAPGAFQTAQADQGGAMTTGVRYTGHIGVGDLDLWSLTATQGHAVVVRIGEIPVPSTVTDPGFWPHIRVVSPAGLIVDSATADKDAEVSFTAPLTGTYTVIVSAYYSGGANAYHLSRATFGPFQTSSGDHGGALANAVASQGAIDLGDLDLWSFSACQGNSLVVTLSEIPVGSGTPDPNFWPWFRVIGPAGTIVAQNVNTLTATATFAAPATGPYTIVAATYYAGGTGDYLVRVNGACTPPSGTPVSINDAYTTPHNTALVVQAPGVMANDTNVSPATVAVVAGVGAGALSLNANGSFTYTPPLGYSGSTSFTYQATNTSGPGNVAAVTIVVGSATLPTAAPDTFTLNADQTSTVPAPGVLFNDISPTGAPLSAALVSPTSNGGVNLSANGGFTYTPNAGFAGTDLFTYRATTAAGASNTVTVTINVETPTNVGAPTELYASLIAGNQVTIRWKAPTSGLTPTQYLLEGGIAPNAPIAVIPTGSAVPILRFGAPNGSFYLRVRAVAGSQTSAPSNEILIHVNMPVAPSAPVGLTGTVNNSEVALSWRNTFAGGAPTSVLLDVNGTLAGSLNLGLTESFTYNGIPGGTYTFSVRAQNGAGVSPPSNAVTLTFPGPCSGVPQSPDHFLAFNVGNMLNLLWDPAGAGAATTHYLLQVSGAFNVSVPMFSRGIAVPVPPGTYTFSVAAVNACGTGAFTTPMTVTIP